MPGLACVCVGSVTKQCLTLCNPVDHSPSGSSVHGILQARILGGLPFPSPGDLPNPGTEPRSPGSPTLAGGVFTTEPPGKLHTWPWCEAKGWRCLGDASACPWYALFYPLERNPLSSGLVVEAGLPMFRKLSGGRRCVDLYLIPLSSISICSQ